MSEWEDIERAFEETIDADPGDRAMLLDRWCLGLPGVRAEVEALLAAHDRAGDFITPSTLSPDDGSTPWLPAPHVGDQVGPYRLVERIAEGGMGVVYRGERADDEYRQEVAVKVIGAPALVADGGRRFRAERQILAALHHQNIVTFLDGGFTPAGGAYLVMEFANGPPITEYCRTHRLGVEARLRLFVQVCSAVHYAHRHGVVHRDIKPGNVVVTADGIPKVLDFGIAKLLDDQAGTPFATLDGRRFPLMTPNYASPEQLRGVEVTTSSDVYSLGVLLFEMLADVRPYETANRPWDEVLEQVLERPVTRPSTVARVTGDGGYDVRRALRGDLDAIVMHAMAKAPDDRYPSARSLADDVERFLRQAPVVARTPSFRYVAGRFASRHRSAVAAMSLSVILLVGALVLATWEARRAMDQQARAERRFADVHGLARKLIFTIHDAVAPLPGSTPVRQTIVAEALAYLERLSNEGGNDARLQLDLAQAYARIGRVQGYPATANLGDRRGAINSFRKALALLAPAVATAQASPGAVSAYVETAEALSQTLRVAGERDEAIRVAKDGVRIATIAADQASGSTDARLLLGRAVFAEAIAVGNPLSKPIWERALVLYEGLLAEAPDHPGRQRNVALVEKYLGSLDEDQGDYAAALRHHERARDLDERRLRAKPGDRTAQFDVAIDLSNLGYAQWHTHDYPGSVTMYQRSLEMREALANSDPKDVLARSKVAFIHRQLASVWSDADRPAEAERQIAAAVRIYEELKPGDANLRLQLADALMMRGNFERSGGRPAQACATLLRAHALLNGVPETDRRNRQGGLDLLTLIERGAAGCPASDASLGGSRQGLTRNPPR